MWVMNTTSRYVSWEAGSPTTQYWKVASVLALKLCCHNTTPLGRVGMGRMVRNTHAAAAWWGEVGRPQGEGTGATLQRRTELQCHKHVAKLLTAKNSQQPDWSAMPQIETGWFFLSKGIGPNETKRQIAAAVPYQRRIFIIYSMKKGLLVMLCLSIQPHLHR